MSGHSGHSKQKCKSDHKCKCNIDINPLPPPPFPPPPFPPPPPTTGGPPELITGEPSSDTFSYNLVPNPAQSQTFSRDTTTSIIVPIAVVAQPPTAFSNLFYIIPQDNGGGSWKFTLAVGYTFPLLAAGTAKIKITLFLTKFILPTDAMDPGIVIASKSHNLTITSSGSGGTYKDNIVVAVFEDMPDFSVVTSSISYQFISGNPAVLGTPTISPLGTYNQGVKLSD